MIRKVCILFCCALGALLGSAPSLAQPEHPDFGYNGWRIYGEVVQVFTSSANPDWRALIVREEPAGLPVRLESPNAPEVGADLLAAGEWVVIEGRLAGVTGCLDGVNTEARPTYIYRWTGSAWTVFDPGCHCWIPW